MKNLNQVTVQGNLTSTPQLVENELGKITYFDIACNNSFKNSKGEEINNTTFIKCEAKSNQATYITNYFKSGDTVIITGSLKNKTSNISDKQIQTLSVKVSDIILIKKSNNS